MHRAAARRVLSAALVVVLAALTVPAPALGKVVSAKTTTLTAAQAAQISAMESDFGTEVANYVSVTRELHRTEDEVAQVTSQIASGQAEVALAQSQLASRAVELYRDSNVGLLETIFSAQSISDLWMRVNFLAMITDRDAQMLRDLRLSQTEEAWLQESLQMRVTQLQKLQVTADKQQKQLLADLAAEQAKAAAMNASFVPGVESTSTTLPTGATPSTAFNRAYIVSENNFRGGSAMSAADIQAFLNSQPTALKSYTGKDHFGQTKTAAQMISDACVRFNINPKTILATLQKEQSLLSTKHPSASQYNGAMGAGMPDSGNNAASMQGFGQQIYWGAEKFDKNARDWHTGMNYVDSEFGLNQPCLNEGTFAQYRYTPHYSGVMSFWTIFWRYFGNPVG